MSSFGFSLGLGLGGQQKALPGFRTIITRASDIVVTRSGLTVVGRS